MGGFFPGCVPWVGEFWGRGSDEEEEELELGVKEVGEEGAEELVLSSSVDFLLKASTTLAGLSCAERDNARCLRSLVFFGMGFDVFCWGIKIESSWIVVIVGFLTEFWVGTWRVWSDAKFPFVGGFELEISSSVLTTYEWRK